MNDLIRAGRNRGSITTTVAGDPTPHRAALESAQADLQTAIASGEPYAIEFAERKLNGVLDEGRAAYQQANPPQPAGPSLFESGARQSHGTAPSMNDLLRTAAGR